MFRLKSTIWMLFIPFAINVEHIAAVQQVETLDTRHFNVSSPTHITTRTVERVATFPNGCYKERITEPDLWHAARFFQTEQLICPPSVNASTFTMLTQEIQRNNSANHTTHFIPANNIPATSFVNSPHNVPYAPHGAPAGSNPVGFMPPPAVSAATNHPVSPTVGQQQQQFDPAVIKSNGTSHAAVLSKKTLFYDHGKKKNSTKSLNDFNSFFVFAVTGILFYCNRN